MIIPLREKLKRRPRVVWAAKVNLSGLYSTKPIKCTWNNGAWWDEEGNLGVNDLGLHVEDRIITYVSHLESDVAMWISGARSVLTMLNDWSHSSYNGLKHLE